MRRVIGAVVLLAGLFVATPVSPSRPVEASSCQATGEGCAVGMTGPGGGIIFYDAGSQQWWGRFLEAAFDPIRVSSVWGPATSIYGSAASTALQRQSTAIGMGRTNTDRMRAAGASLALTAVPANQVWHIPSKDELDALYNYWRYNKPAGVNYGQIPVWTSSESENTFAWYQLFHDGTQFTDANGIIPGLKTNKNYMMSARHTGSNFAPAPMHVIPVRAFPNTGAQPPAATLVTAPTNNPTCATQALGCKVGDIGPGGGIVVYDAGSPQAWGRYLEIAPKACELSRLSYATPSVGALFSDSVLRTRSKFIGQGSVNTFVVATNRPNSAAAAVRKSKCGGYNDWFLPSKDELNEAFRWLSHGRKGLQLTPVGQFERGYYWTSSDYNGSTAWSQYFADGQQFDRVQTLSGNKKPPARPFLVRPMRAFLEGMPGKSSTAVEIPSGERALTIIGERGTVKGKPGILVEGESTGFASGTVLKPWLKFPGQTAYTEASAEVIIAADGTFTWSRKTGKKTYVYLKAPDGTTSNRVIIPAN
jgi:hypothetical protein